MSAPQAIGIDLGGTKILAVRACATGEVLATVRRDTPRGSADQLVGVLTELVMTLREDGVGAVGIGLPGMVNAETGALTYAPGLGFPAARTGDRNGVGAGCRRAAGGQGQGRRTRPARDAGRTKAGSDAGRHAAGR